MGSPFPLYSSGQSIPDERQGYSPRDFGMVPHTPQIRGHRMSCDQSVPRTPDAAVVPSSQADVTGGLPSTPCLSTTGSQHSTHLLPRESPNTGPDQQVPVTPQGCFLLTRYQSPIPYYSHFNSPSLSLESSQEIATMADSANANTNTPSRINTPFECAKLERIATQNRFSRANNTPPPGAELHTNSRRVSIAHTRQTPSLSSRRRLTLEPCRLESSNLRVVQHNQLIQQITMTTSDENCSPSRNCSISTSSDSFHHAANNNSHTQGTTQISHSEESCEPDKDNSDIEIDALGTDQTNNNNINNNNNIINNNINNTNNSNNNNVNPRGSTVLPSSPKRDHNITIPIVRDSGDHLVAIDDQQQQIHKGYPNPRTPSLFGDASRIADQMDSSTVKGSDNKRAEIEKRVQRVLDKGAGTSTRTSPVPAHSASTELEDEQTSVLTLFAEDDYIFG